MPQSAIILTSGGLDSATCLAIARDQGFALLYAMTFDYGQRHHHELRAAELIARSMNVVEHRLVTIDLRQFGASALTADIAVPHDQVDQPGIPITYVPARNTIFLSYALAWAEVLKISDVFIGVNAVDFSGYPDCRPVFIQAFQAAARAGTTLDNFTIHAPLLHLSKAQIIQLGHRLNVDFSLTHSCYDPAPDGRACGHCDSCLLRRRGFAQAGVADPTRYIS